MAILAKTTHTTAGQTRASSGRRRRIRSNTRNRATGGEQLEARMLLTAAVAAEVAVLGTDTHQEMTSPSTTGNQPGRQISEWSGRRRVSSSRSGSPAAPRNEPSQHFVEVLVFHDCGPFNLGHSDIALTGPRGTTVYGQHQVGAGNGGFPGSTFRRRSLPVYLRQESGAGHRVTVSRIPETASQFKGIQRYLDYQWLHDDDYSLLDDNCAQNVGYVLKRWDLLSRRPAGRNVINDDAFQLPRGDLYDDWLKQDPTWDNRVPGYLGPTPAGSSLYDSVQSTPAAGGGRGSGSSGSSGTMSAADDENDEEGNRGVSNGKSSRNIRRHSSD